MSWRQQKHQCLCFHYWDYLTNFWRNSWQSIIDVVERLGRLLGWQTVNCKLRATLIFCLLSRQPQSFLKGKFVCNLLAWCCMWCIRHHSSNDDFEIHAITCTPKIKLSSSVYIAWQPGHLMCQVASSLVAQSRGRWLTKWPRYHSRCKQMHSTLETFSRIPGWFNISSFVYKFNENSLHEISHHGTLHCVSFGVSSVVLVLCMRRYI